MLRQRIITAFILIPLTLLVLFYLPPTAFALLTAFVALGGAWEWTHLMGIKQRAWRWVYLLILAVSFFAVLFLPVASLLAATAVWWLLALLLVLLFPALKGWNKSIILCALMGLFVIVPCWRSIIYIHNQPDGFYPLLFLLVLTFGADSTAYFVGKKWGKTKLAPKVSPGKSLQGAIGALCFAICLAVLVLALTRAPLFLWGWSILLSMVTVTFSIVGDLFESMMKREAGVKDSGAILPGHGGILDRIDSLTASAPIFAFGAWLLGTYAA